MTFIHLGNCLILAFAPHLLLYRYSGLAEYSGLWRIAQAGFAYCLTQFVKMLLLATFFAEIEQLDFGETLTTQEFMRSSVDVLDLIGIHIAISHLVSGKGEVRFLASGLGWAASHSIASYLIPLFVGSRATAFHWKFIQMSVDSNIDLLFFLALAPLIWLFNRKDQPTLRRNAILLILCVCVFRGALVQFISRKFGLVSWTLLATKAAAALLLDICALTAYAYHVNS